MCLLYREAKDVKARSAGTRNSVIVSTWSSSMGRICIMREGDMSLFVLGLLMFLGKD